MHRTSCLPQENWLAKGLTIHRWTPWCWQCQFHGRVHYSSTLADFTAAVKADPGKTNWTSPGVGTTPYLAGEILKMRAGLDMQHIPYKAVPAAVTAVLSGDAEAVRVGTVDLQRHGRLHLGRRRIVGGGGQDQLSSRNHAASSALRVTACCIGAAQ